MELLTCANCASVYGDAHERCPACDADHTGAGGRVELDVTARAAVARLGGLYGGILESGEESLLWCARGVCLWSAQSGLVWARATGGLLEDVALDGQTVRLARGGRTLVLDRADGSQLR